MQIRWPSLKTPEDWIVNKLMIEDQANVEESYSYVKSTSPSSVHCHYSYDDAFSAAVATHYNIEEARLYIRDAARRSNVALKPVIPVNMRGREPSILKNELMTPQKTHLCWQF